MRLNVRWLLPVLFMISVTAHAADDVSPTALPAAELAVTADIGVKASEAKVSDVKADSADAKVAATDAKADTDKPKVDNRKETEIPLNLDGKKNASAEGGSLFRILLTLSMLGVVGIGAFIYLRKHAIPKERKHQTQIKVLQQHYLGPKKSLAIIRVAGESILIGVTDSNISMIKSLSLLDDEVPEEAPQNFSKVFQSKENEADEELEAAEAVASRKNRKSQSRELDADEEFAISGIKDIVSKRLKGMRSFQ